MQSAPSPVARPAMLAIVALFVGILIGWWIDLPAEGRLMDIRRMNAVLEEQNALLKEELAEIRAVLDRPSP